MRINIITKQLSVAMPDP